MSKLYDIRRVIGELRDTIFATPLENHFGLFTTKIRSFYREIRIRDNNICFGDDEEQNYIVLSFDVDEKESLKNFFRAYEANPNMAIKNDEIGLRALKLLYRSAVRVPMTYSSFAFNSFSGDFGVIFAAIIDLMEENAAAKIKRAPRRQMDIFCTFV